MTDSTKYASFFVGDCLVDPKSNSIIKDRKPVRIEPKAMRVLILLASNAGQVVTREEIVDTVWKGTVVGSDALTNAIIKLRRALRDNAKDPKLIETIPKTGYRLIAPVRQAQDNEAAAPLERRLSAIMYADVAEYSRLTGEDEERTHRILSTSLDSFSEKIRAYNGSVVHFAGDAILAEFATVTEALGCAIEVQRELQHQDVSLSESSPVRFRIGINLGEVIVDRDDIYGDGVNIAARLEGLADAGGICISESIRTAVGNKLPVEYEFMGEQTVKNIAEPVRAYRVLFYPGAQKIKKSRPRMPARFWPAIIGLLAVSIVSAWFLINPVKVVTEKEDLLSKPAIAVLPFANVSVDPEDEYFADGMTDDLITDLAKISGLNVIARSTVFTYKNKAINIRDIGKELGARYIVEGSIRRSGDNLRINIQLVDSETGQHLWADRYDRDYAEFFKIQEDVISQVVSAISVKLTESESEQIEKLPTSNLRAYDYYLRAQQSGYIGGASNLVETLELYAKAIELDTEFADAHAGLARTAVEAWRNDVSDIISGAEARQLAYDSASRALSLDPANSGAYSVLAILQLADGEHQTAIKSARKAVELSPGSSAARLDLGLVLAYAGEIKQGVAEIETVLRLNPKPTPDTLLYAGIVFFLDGDYHRAVDALSQAQSERQNSEPAWTYLAAAYAKLGQPQKAAAAIEPLYKKYPSIGIEYFKARDDYFKREQDLKRFLEGLEAAGVPRWPFNFKGDDRYKLNPEELTQIVFNKTWVGQHYNGTDFIQQVNASGSLAYRSKNTIQTGVASTKGDQLCHRFQAATLNKELCGYVYRNPQGSSEERNEYIVAMPDTLRYFSVTSP